MSDNRGFFITLEGPEGSGKSTQARLLAGHLRRQGREVIVTAEPGGDSVARKIRGLVLDSRNEVVPEGELLLFLAARAQNVRRIILPALDSGAVVVCDRFADSSIAYQGYARGIDIPTLRNLNEFATGGLVPDLTLLLDIPVEVGLERQQDKNRFEAESVEFHRKVREGFLALAAKEPARWVVIDAQGSLEEVAERLTAAVETRFATGVSNNKD